MKLKKIVLLFAFFLCLTTLLCACAGESGAGKTFSISYVLNGGTNAQNNPDSYSKQSETFTLAEPSKTGYSFTGWTYDGQSEPTKTVSVNHGSTGDLTFTANWSLISYHITYELDGGTNAESNPETYDIETDTFMLDEPTKDGFAFLGWTFEGENEPTTEVYFYNGSTGDVTVTAHWALFNYPIFYELDGGTNAENNPESYTEDTDTFTLADPTKSGYEFIGWTFDGQDTPIKTVTIEKGSKGNKEFFANWIRTYKITYYLMDYMAVNAESNPETYNEETETFTLAAPIFVGYEFLGWTYDGQDTPVKEVTITKGSTGDKSFVAHWDAYFNVFEEITGRRVTGLTELGKKQEQLTVPDGVVKIDSFAFQNCVNLKSITIPSSVTEIGKNAFENCSNLESVIFAENSECSMIGEKAFYECRNLTGIVIPAKVTVINENVFFNCNAMKNVTFAENSQCTSIGSGAFYGCVNLDNLVIPEGVQSIGYSTFAYCTSLENVTIPLSLETMDMDAFGICPCKANIDGVWYVDTWVVGCDSSITEVSLREGTRGIAYFALSFSNLTSITFPSSFRSFSCSALNWCEKLEKITVSEENTKFHSSGNCLIETASRKLVAGCNTSVIPNDVTSIGEYAFQGCGNLTNVAIPSSVTSIGKYAFSGCKLLESVTLPSGLTEIPDSLFSDCEALTSFTIPDSVTSFGKYVFSGCSNLTSVKFQGTRAQWDAVFKEEGWDAWFSSFTYTVQCSDD